MINMTLNELLECFHGDKRVIVRVEDDNEMWLDCSLKCYQNNYALNNKYGNLKVVYFDFNRSLIIMTRK